VQPAARRKRLIEAGNRHFSATNFSKKERKNMKHLSVRFLVVAGILCQALLLGPAFGALVDIVPQHAPFVLEINVPKIANLDVMQKLLETAGVDQKKSFDEFVTKTGIDPKKNLKTVLVFVNDMADPETGRPNPGILFQGDFDTSKIIEMVKGDAELSAQVTIDKVEGFDAIRAKSSDAGISVFLDKNTIVLGASKVVDAVAKVKAGKEKGIMTNLTFSNVVGQADKTAGLWGGVVVSPEWAKESKGNAAILPLGAVKAVTFSLDYDEEFNFAFAGQVEKKEEISKVKDALKNIADALAGWASDVPEVSKVFKTAKVEAAETTAKLSIQLSKAAFEGMVKKVQAQLSAPPAKGK